MLHRAASNAYSWWWASHIRTKQSKWLDQSLLDMQEKVAVVLKLIEEDGDSFAKRAEMYYKKRPELIHFVEESYRAYRSLAERYDHLSTELQNANNQLASCFPEQVPFMDEDEEVASPRAQRKMPGGFKPNSNIPSVPKPPIKKDLKSVITTAAKKLGTKKNPPAAQKVPKSGLSKKEIREEIDKHQKQILALQTVKEFVKSSYDNAIAKYWETEEQIKVLQEKVSTLQDELGEGIVIDDEEARRLMAEVALKSCQETLTNLQEKQERSVDETKVETKRIKESRKKLESLMEKFNHGHGQSNKKEPIKAKKTVKGIGGKKEKDQNKEAQELQSIEEKIKQHFNVDSSSSLSITEMAEKIEELVNIVISLETSVSSQTALVKTLRTETDELQSQVRNLEDDNSSLLNDKTDLNKKLKEMEEKMQEVQDLNQAVKNQNSYLQADFTEASCNLNHLSETVQDVKPDEKVDVSKTGGDLNQAVKDQNSNLQTHFTEASRNLDYLPETVQNVKPDEIVDVSKTEGDLNQAFKDQNSNLQTHFSEASRNLDHLSETVQNVKPHEIVDSSKTEGKSSVEVKSDKDIKVTGLTENVAQEDQELKVSGSIENVVQQDNERKVTGSPKNDIRLDKELKINSSQEKEAGSSAEVTFTSESKEEAKTLNPEHSDKSAKDSRSGAAGNYDLSQRGANNQADISLDSSQNLKGNNATQISPGTQNILTVDSPKKETVPADGPDWQQLFIDGMQDREKALLAEYTTILRSYKCMKKKLSDLEKKNQESILDSSLQLKELKTDNAMKDEEIKLLRQKLSLLQRSVDGNEDIAENQDIAAMLKREQPETSAIEEKFRTDIDEILEENLDFWLKFSTTFTETQKFENTIKDLQADVSKYEERKRSEGSSSTKYNLKSDARATFKHLTEIQAEITVWLEKSALLKEELQCRFTSLCEIQEEIMKALKASAEDDEFKFTSYQAAKFQGEVLNMKQENHKVADELQAGLDHVTTLQIDVEKALAKLNEQFGLTRSRRQENGQLGHAGCQSGVPLRSFIFGVKPKKQNKSIFSCMTPGMHRKHRGLRGQGSV